jgi:Outer membrane protein beta-barrel domain
MDEGKPMRRIAMRDPPKPAPGLPCSTAPGGNEPPPGPDTTDPHPEVNLMRSIRPLFAAALVLAAPAAAHAQRGGCASDYVDECGYDRPATRNYFGASFTMTRPQGEFGDYVGDGFGGDLHYMRALDPQGLLALRVDAGLAIYGYESYTVDDDYGYLTDVSTSNNIAWIGVGPQIGLPDGRLRPYVNAHAGYSFLWTSTTFDEGYDYYDDYDYSVTEQDDWSFSYGAGAGVYIPVTHGRTPVSIDLGIRYHNNGDAEYLREGDIVGNPDGSVTLYPVRSDTDLLTYHLGVSIGVR